MYDKLTTLLLREIDITDHMLSSLLVSKQYTLKSLSDHNINGGRYSNLNPDQKLLSKKLKALFCVITHIKLRHQKTGRILLNILNYDWHGENILGIINTINMDESSLHYIDLAKGLADKLMEDSDD